MATAGGSRYEIARYCPHAGAALDNAPIEGHILTCLTITTDLILTAANVLMAIVRCVRKCSSEAKIGKAERMEGTRIASPPMVPWMQIFLSSIAVEWTLTSECT